MQISIEDLNIVPKDNIDYTRALCCTSSRIRNTGNTLEQRFSAFNAVSRSWVSRIGLIHYGNFGTAFRFLSLLPVVLRDTTKHYIVVTYLRLLRFSFTAKHIPRWVSLLKWCCRFIFNMPGYKIVPLFFGGPYCLTCNVSMHHRLLQIGWEWAFKPLCTLVLVMQYLVIREAY